MLREHISHRGRARAQARIVNVRCWFKTILRAVTEAKRETNERCFIWAFQQHKCVAWCIITKKNAPHMCLATFMLSPGFKFICWQCTTVASSTTTRPAPIPFRGISNEGKHSLNTHAQLTYLLLVNYIYVVCLVLVYAYPPFASWRCCAATPFGKLLLRHRAKINCIARRRRQTTNDIRFFAKHKCTLTHVYMCSCVMNAHTFGFFVCLINVQFNITSVHTTSSDPLRWTAETELTKLARNTQDTALSGSQIILHNPPHNSDEKIASKSQFLQTAFASVMFVVRLGYNQK